MMKWVLDDPARFLSERAGIEELSKESWLSGVRWRLNSRIEVEFDITAGSRKFELVLTYPDVFPETPAFIRPRDFSSRLSFHQFGAGGSLCLEYRPDNWHSGVTGADLVRSAHKLLASENVDGAPPVVSAHRVTLGQRLRAEPERFVCTSGMLESLKTVRTNKEIGATVRIIVHGKDRVAFVSELENNSGKLRHIEDQPVDEATFGPLFTYEGVGRFFRIPALDPKKTIESFEDLSSVVGVPLTMESLFPDSGNADQNNTKKYFVLLIDDQATSLRVFRTFKSDKTLLVELAVIQAERLEERLPSEHRKLQNFRVAIIGVGSIGSKVAISLARSGVGKLLLIDDDFLLPGNLRRNELSWIGIGVHKAHAVRELAHLVAPRCEVTQRIHRITGQESARDAAAALDDIASCDLIIDATADAEVFVILAAIARRNKKILCWGELFAGGIGGLIARARPDADPNPLAVRNAVLNFLAEQPPAPYQNAVAYDMDNLRPLTAYDADVGHIACALTRFAVDGLLHQNDGIFRYAAYLIGLRNEWIFSCPFDVHPIDVKGEGWDSNVTASEEDRKAALEVLTTLAAEKKE